MGLVGLGGSAVAQDMPLSQVLIPGEGWQLVIKGFGFSDAPTVDDKGNFYFSDFDKNFYKIINVYKFSFICFFSF